MKRLRLMITSTVFVVLAIQAGAAEVSTTEVGPSPNDPPSLKTGLSKLTGHVQRHLEASPVLLVWLVDRSMNLNGKRHELADLTPTMHAALAAHLKRRTAPPLNEHLHSAVVAYGREAQIVTPDPLSDHARIPKLIREIDSDETGDENVFGAIDKAVGLWKHVQEGPSPRQIVLAILTDERGDDADRVEEVSRLCERLRIPVYCLGSIAPFGQEHGLVRLKLQDGFNMEVALDQGPESISGEVLSVPWIDRPRVSSGFGPFALSWLCERTGGGFLPVHDAAKIRFDVEVMARYRPLGLGPRSVRDTERSISANAAKVAVISAAEKCRVQQPRTPPVTFRADSANALRTTATQGQRIVAVNQFHADQYVQILKTGESDRDSLDTPRWRAAYDLAMGQALAMKARSMLWNVRVAQMKVHVRPLEEEGANTWKLVPGNDSTGAGSVHQRIVEQATAFLNRVVAEHPESPFAHVATLELQHGFGWTWEETAIVYPKTKQKSPDLLNPGPRKVIRRRRPEL